MAFYRLTRALTHTGVFLALLLAGCGEPPQKADSDEAFFDQPAWPEFQQTAREFSDHYDPTLTEWETVEELASTPDDCDNASDTLHAWAAQKNLIGTPEDEELDIDLRTREEEDGTVNGLLQRWAFRDDALAGTDHRVQMEPEDGCWQVREVQYRQYCRRGATDEGLCQ